MQPRAKINSMNYFAGIQNQARRRATAVTNSGEGGLHALQV